MSNRDWLNRFNREWSGWSKPALYLVNEIRNKLQYDYLASNAELESSRRLHAIAIYLKTGRKATVKERGYYEKLANSELM